MKVAFRVDASLTIGTGHVMRCLALAQRLKQYGVDCFFLSRDHDGHLHNKVASCGFPLLSLGAADSSPIWANDSGYVRWLGVDPLRDAADTQVRLEGLSVDWLVVDHYGLDAHWEHAVRSTCTRIMAIDDLANRDHAVDVLLDQNLGKTLAHYEARVPASCKLLLGPDYALLRTEFALFRTESLSRRRHGQLRKVLVSMGGVDLQNATGSVLEALSAWAPSTDLEVTVVMGPSAPWCDKVRQQARTLPFPTEVLVNVQRMGGLMCETDLVIGAAGSSSWERCFLGVPTLLFVLADNQRDIADALSQTGAAHLLGGPDEVGHLCRVLDQLVENPARLRSMSISSAKLIEGHGADRVAHHILEGPRV